MPDPQKDYLTREVIQACVSRFGNLLKQEIQTKAISELKLLKEASHNAKLDNINCSKLVDFANIGRTFFPNLEGINIIAGIGYLRTGSVDIAKEFARKELREFPSSIDAKWLLDCIRRAEVSNGYANDFIKDSGLTEKGKKPRRTWEYIRKLSSIKFYAGDIPPMPQYNGLIGLSMCKHRKSTK